MPSLNIYVPDDLKIRMDAIPNLDWSAVAQAAFENEIVRAEFRGSVPGNFGATVERLRAGKLRRQEAQMTEGYEIGYRWAKLQAEYTDIEAIVNAEDYDDAHIAMEHSETFDFRDVFEDEATDLLVWKGFVDGVTVLYHEIDDKI